MVKKTDCFQSRPSQFPEFYFYINNYGRCESEAENQKIGYIINVVAILSASEINFYILLYRTNFR